MLPYDAKLAEIRKASLALRKLEQEAAQIAAQCEHEYAPHQYAPIVIPGYTIPADPPGTMGVDWRGEQHVSEQRIDEWVRVCKKCGYTDRTQQTAIRPTGRDGLKQEVPDFSNKTPARRKWS